MAVINWSKEAANIADTSGLFGSLDSVLDTKNVLKNVLTEEGKAFVKEAFNKYRVVMWLTKDFEAKNVERFGETDIEGSTKLVTGQKVIRLAATESKQIPIIYWQDDHYEATQLPNDTYLVNLPYEDSTWANAKKVFLNDVKRIYKIIKDQENKLTEIGDVIENVEELLVWAENENIVDRDIVELKLKFEEALRVNKDDKVETVQRYSNFLLSFLNQNSTDGSGNAEVGTIFLPLSNDFFVALVGKGNITTKFPTLGDPYSDNQKVYIDKEGTASGGGSSASGEGITKGDSRLLDVKKELVELKKLVQENYNMLTGSLKKEADWVKSLPANRIENAVRFIMINPGTWFYDNRFAYASNIGLKNTVGIVYTPALLTILIHELNVNSTPAYNALFNTGNADSHIEARVTEIAWKMQSDKIKIPFTVEYNDTYKSIDILYQCASEITAITLAIMNKIRNL